VKNCPTTKSVNNPKHTSDKLLFRKKPLVEDLRAAISVPTMGGSYPPAWTGNPSASDDRR
jgi:hypothetical protein